MVNMVKFRLEQYYPIQAFKIRATKTTRHCIYISYIDGPPPHFIRDLLHGLKCEIEIERTLSDEARRQTIRRNKIKPMDGVNYHIHVANIAKQEWFPLKFQTK